MGHPALEEHIDVRRLRPSECSHPLETNPFFFFFVNLLKKRDENKTKSWLVDGVLNPFPPKKNFSFVLNSNNLHCFFSPLPPPYSIYPK